MISEQVSAGMTHVSAAQTESKASSFDTLFRSACKKLKKARKSQAKFQRELESTVQLYCQEVLPKERAILLAPSCELIEHLIQFLPKPSLTAEARDSLLNWLDSLIGNVSRLDHALAESLRERVKGALGQIIRQSADPDVALNVNELLKSFEQNIDEEDTSFGQKQTAQSKPVEPDILIAGQEDQLLTSSWFTGLFRKTAQAIHPDKEPDPTEAIIKAELMSQLLNARKSGDIYTVLELYAEYVNADPDLGKTEMNQVLDLLQKQIQGVKAQKHEAIMSSPVRALAYDRLYASTRQQQAEKIKNTMTHFYDIRNSLLYCRKKIKSVSQLTDFLQ